MDEILYDMAAQIKNDNGQWISTKERLSAEGKRVLIISASIPKRAYGNISDGVLTAHGQNRELLFSPYAYSPNHDVKWWMPIPRDGWCNINDVQPTDGEAVLTMGRYGDIRCGVRRQSTASVRFDFHPFVMEVLFWRPIPNLPQGVVLHCQKIFAK